MATVLGLVSSRLSAQCVAFMLTGSFALAYYATPRATRDLDMGVGVAIDERAADSLVTAFDQAFYIDAARAAARSERMFDLICRHE